ncbi:MAG: hypothetical protein AABZ55_07355, partial [Bdellovibrionota bacterium]
LYVILALFASHSATAAENVYFEEFQSEDICPEVIRISGSSIQCRDAKNSEAILAAKLVRKNIVSIQQAGKIFGNQFQIWSAFDLGVLPDDSTKNIYDYIYLLKNKLRGNIGYLSISGYVNTEMDIKLQITARYNSSGQLVSASVE